VSESRKKTTSRRELARNPQFEQVSPEVGELDESAVDDAMSQDPDEMLALLADLTGATDPKLRELSKRLAGRLYLDLARQGPMRPRGVGKLIEQRWTPDGGDLDLDASLEAITAARAAGEAVDPERLRVRGWATPATAICLVVDRSGSMGGAPLATSAIAAAAVSWRAPSDYSVLSFGKEVIAVKSQDRQRPVDEVVDGVLALRGFGTTDVAAGLSAAAEQLSRTRAARRITVLLSDCRSTEPGDPVAVASRLDELVIIAPEGDSTEAETFAAQVGARLAVVAGPSQIPEVINRVLER
jgi:Mg-chelatase subunit ChlD